MTGYITGPPGPSDPDEFAQAAFDYIAANIPGWSPSEGQVETWLVYAHAFMVSTLSDLAQTTQEAIFRYFGASLLARHLPYLAPISAVPATLTSTWTATNSAGYAIPAGTQVAFQTGGDTFIGFTVADDMTIPPGSTSLAGVPLTAADGGTTGNGLTAPIVMVDDLAWVVSVTADMTPSGGVDAESDDDYLNRLADQLQLLAPRPILPADFALFALNVPGVGRAFAVDGYNPADSSTGNERMVAVAALDTTGGAASNPLKSSVLAFLTAAREVSFVVNMINPTLTAVNVNFTGRALPGYDPDTVSAAAVVAVTDYLSPLTFGGTTWPSTVRLLDVAGVLAAVQGFTFAAGGSVTLNGSAADLTLTGVAPLPTAGTITPLVT